MATAKAVAAKTLISPKDHILILIDFQSQMAFARSEGRTISALQPLSPTAPRG